MVSAGMLAVRLVAVISALAALACDTPSTVVVVDNDYPASSPNVIYQAFWLSTPFTTPIVPGASSDPQPTVFASPNTAYAVLAPGWDPASGTTPTTLVVLESRMGYELHYNSTLDIHVSDSTFAGNCAAGSTLSQADADFITQQVFKQTFAGLHYDAATCTTTPGP